MKNREEFLKQLNDLVKIAKDNGNQITGEDVKAYFSEADLTEEQIELVFDYLLAQKVVVKGYLKMSAPEEKDEATYTEEEEAYLKDYAKEFNAFQKEQPNEREALYQKVVQGDEKAINRLVELYLPTVVEIAKEMYHPGIFLGDMIQEGGLGLVLGIGQVTDVSSAHTTITAQIRQSLQMMIEEYEEVRNRDQKMVAKVNMLDEAIKTLTEELGRKVTIDELAIHIGMTEEEIMDILRLMGEDHDEDEQDEDHDGECHCGEAHN